MYQEIAKKSDDYFTVYIPELKDKSELFAIFADSLSFPEYFGLNWDALYDCLVDLSWLEMKDIVIVHENEPLFDEETLKGYLQILDDVKLFWEDNGERKLSILLPENSSLGKK